jgi:hypothetical protein
VLKRVFKERSRFVGRQGIFGGMLIAGNLVLLVGVGCDNDNDGLEVWKRS